MPEDKPRLGAVASENVASAILIAVAPAELVDKITILELKTARMNDPAKVANVARELAILRDYAQHHIPRDAAVAALALRLKEINARIWDLEDRIRDCERGGDFGPRFVETARLIYRTNDQRAETKKEINLHLGSAIVEEKSYTAY